MIYLLHGIDDAKYTRPSLYQSLQYCMLVDYCWQTLELSNQPLKEMYLTTYDHVSSTVPVLVPVPSRNQPVQTCIVPLYR